MMVVYIRRVWDFHFVLLMLKVVLLFLETVIYSEGALVFLEYGHSLEYGRGTKNCIVEKIVVMRTFGTCLTVFMVMSTPSLTMSYRPQPLMGLRAHDVGIPWLLVRFSF